MVTRPWNHVVLGTPWNNIWPFSTSVNSNLDNGFLPKICSEFVRFQICCLSAAVSLHSEMHRSAGHLKEYSSGSQANLYLQHL